MRIKRKNGLRLLVLIGDLIIIPASFIIGHYLRFGNLEELSLKVPVLNLAFMTLGYLGIFYFFDLYKLEKDYFSLEEIVNLFTGILVAAVFVSFLNYGLFLDPIGRGIFVIANVILLMLTFAWRLFSHRIIKYFVKAQGVIIVGAGEAGQEIGRIIQSKPSDYQLVGFLDDDRGLLNSPVAGTGKTVLGSVESVLGVCHDYNVDLIVMAVSKKEGTQLGKMMIKARLEGIEVIDMPDLYQEIKERIPIHFIPETWFLKARGFDWSETSILVKVKRLLDMTFSSLILVVTFPIWILIALLIKMNSKGPVFYTQRRVGQNEKIFSLYKFRSMIDKAENEMPVWAEEDDKRVTSVGRILRKLHLDELPQLLNVLKGEMSLVGARPERPVFVQEFEKKIPYYSLRHFLKPGLTGWAQVNYTYASSLEDSMDKLEYDLYYVYHMTLLLDLRILLKTLQNIVLKAKRPKTHG